MGFTHSVIETEFRNIIGKPFMRGLGGLTLVVKKANKKSTVAEAAEEWQRMSLQKRCYQSRVSMKRPFTQKYTASAHIAEVETSKGVIA
jgi:hypothetical protein